VMFVQGLSALCIVVISSLRLLCVCARATAIDPSIRILIGSKYDLVCWCGNGGFGGLKMCWAF